MNSEYPPYEPPVTYEDLQEKLKIAVVALKWYADDKNYDEGTSFLRGCSDVQSDAGNRADEALKQIGVSG